MDIRVPVTKVKDDSRARLGMIGECGTILRDV